MTIKYLLNSSGFFDMKDLDAVLLNYHSFEDLQVMKPVLKKLASSSDLELVLVEEIADRITHLKPTLKFLKKAGYGIFIATYALETSTPFLTFEHSLYRLKKNAEVEQTKHLGYFGDNCFLPKMPSRIPEEKVKKLFSGFAEIMQHEDKNFKQNGICLFKYQIGVARESSEDYDPLERIKQTRFLTQFFS